MTARILTQSYLKECFDYDPLTGILTWRTRPEFHFSRLQDCKTWNIRFAGKAIGGKDGRGYLHVSIDGKLYRCHRIIWKWMAGKWPVDQTDHKDHDRANNRRLNLREVSNAENRRNLPLSSRNKSGFTGVYWGEAPGKWRTRITVNGKLIHLGYFTKLGDAIAARKTANIKYGFHENHGKV